MTVAIGYTRLSQDSDTSIGRQKRHIREYADAHGFDLVNIYDDGEQSSGFDTAERDQYQKVRRLVGEGEIDAVVVNDKRRLARDIDEVMRLIPDLRTSDVGLHTHQDGAIDLSDPMRAAIEILMAAAAYEEKLEEIRKSIEATEERIANGKWHGGAPFGTHFPDGEDDLARDPTEWETLKRVFELLDAGEPFRSISEETGLSVGAVSKINDRGRGFYREYGEL